MTDDKNRLEAIVMDLEHKLKTTKENWAKDKEYYEKEIS